MARPIRKSFRHDVLTGSPARVGLPHGEFLKPGDKVIATAEGVGELHMEIAQLPNRSTNARRFSPRDNGSNERFRKPLQTQRHYAD
jgi:hypothetical protein